MLLATQLHAHTCETVEHNLVAAGMEGIPADCMQELSEERTAPQDTRGLRTFTRVATVTGGKGGVR